MRDLLFRGKRKGKHEGERVAGRLTAYYVCRAAIRFQAAGPAADARRAPPCIPEAPREAQDLIPAASGVVTGALAAVTGALPVTTGTLPVTTGAAAVGAAKAYRYKNVPAGLPPDPARTPPIP
ncbi:MAG: hypothetical protein LBD13_08375, partial [Spirochaetaceae bacterium]|nr:hypothetical protein [Spirochaetaceae bacterium]